MRRATIGELAESLASGRTTAQALVEQSLAAIADQSGEGATAFIKTDAEGARAAACYFDGLRKRGRAPSRFAGIPFSVKDLFDISGEVTTAGSKVLQGAAPAKADALAIIRLKAQGFIVIGRTNMTEFAYSGVGLNPHYGTPRSPYDRKTGRIPGGSSSGAAVSVADGMVVLGIGSDTGGSCRIPASYCGTVGYKPSHGRIPLTGTFPLSPSFDAIGPLANSVSCCAAADAIMAGDWKGDIAARSAGTLRLAILQDYVLDGLEPEVEQAFARALSRLEKSGAKLADMRFPALNDLPEINAKGGIVPAEAYHAHRARIEARGSEYCPRVRSRIEAAAAISADDYLGYLEHRRRMIGEFSALMAGFDAVVLPTVMNTAPPISALAEDADYRRYNVMSLRNTSVGNFLDGCAISIPMHQAGEAPSGLMLMAPHGCDAGLFAVAMAVEEALT